MAGHEQFSGQSIDAIDLKLLVAARDGILDDVHAALNSGANINVLDLSARTSLHRAITEGHARIALLLLERGAAIDNSIDFKSARRFIYALRKRDNSKLRAALKNAGASLNWADIEGDPISICDAVQYGDLAEVCLLLNADPSCANKTCAGPLGGTPLMEAAINNNFEIAQCLIEHGAEINAKCADCVEVNATYLSAEYGSSDVLRLLLAHGGDFKLKDARDGRTPLHQAARFGQRKCVELLLDYGADPNAKDESDGMGSLFFAQDDVIRSILLQHGAT